MNRNRWALCVLTSCLWIGCFLTGRSAGAAVTVFTDRTAWQAAASGSIQDGFEADTPGNYQTPFTTRGGAQLTAVTGSAVTIQVIDSGLFDGSRELHFRDFAQGVRFTFTTDSNAFGFDYDTAIEGWTVNAEGKATILAPNSKGFVGYINDAGPIASFVLTGGAGAQGGISIDNLSRIGALFSGLPHDILGDAEAEVASDGTLVVSNIGPSGEDGVAITLGEASGMFSRMPLSFSGMPNGAYAESVNIGVVDGTPGQVAGSLRLTRVDDSIRLTPDFSPLGAPSYRATIFDNGKPVLTRGGLKGGALGFLGIDIDIDIRCTTIPLGGGGTESSWSIHVDVDLGITVAGDDGDTPVKGDQILLISEDAIRNFESFSRVELRAAGMPQIMIKEEGVDLSGFLYRSLGGVALEASGGDLTLGGIDASGRSGVAIGVGQAESVDVAFSPIDPGDAAPLGASIEANAIGEVNGVQGQPLGKLSITKAAAGYPVAADFLEVDSPTQRVQLLHDGEVIADLPHHSGIAAIASKWPDQIGKLFPVGGLKCYSMDWLNDTSFTIDGVARVGDGLRVLAEGPGSDIGRISDFEIRAASLPTLTLTETSALGGCVSGPDQLCLNNGRFKVEAEWKTGQGTSGHGRAVPLTGDTGYFWFFNSANVEVLIKVLDGCGLNQRFWVFAGGLTDVETRIVVTDTQTGDTQTYTNLQGNKFQPIQDTSAFATCGTAVAASALQDLEPAQAEASDWLKEAMRSLAAPPTALLLNDSRFKVEVEWETSQGTTGVGQAVPLTSDTGYFWFFNSDNVEVVIKVLNGCGLNQRFWVFAGGLTDVKTRILVTDTQTGASKAYLNPQGKAFQPIQDTSAFATCP